LDKGKLSSSSHLLRLSLLGLNFAFSIFAGLGLGWGAQKLFHCGDWILIAGALFGILAGYYTLFIELKKIQNENTRPPAP
jgi:F0F1-type ATP synthase assembly protein I